MKAPVRSLRMSFLLLAGVLFLSLSLVAQPKQITILHTNDMHASFLPREAYWVRTTPKPLVGGFNELAFVVDSIRQTRTASILLDGGDLMTGHPITDRVYEGAEGGALVKMMNLIGYEGWTPGNHDFDISYANFLKLTKIAEFPVFTANLVDEATGLPVTKKEYIIIEKNGLRIGIFGIMSGEYYNLVSKNSAKGVRLLSPLTEATRMIELLRPQTDLLIALTHAGVDDDSILAVSTKGIDVIIGGHSHTRLRTPKYINGVVIAQSGSNAENLGVLDLTVENKSVTKWEGMLKQLWVQPGRQTAVTALVDSFDTEIKKEYSEFIGTLVTDPNSPGAESALGVFIARAQQEAAHADIGFMNNGGVRKRLLPGPITKQDLFEVLPFRNVLVKFPLTGKQVRDIALHYVKNQPSIQISGIQCEWKRDEKGNVEILKLLVNGNQVDENATYFGAASDYFTGEAIRYIGLEAPPLEYFEQTTFTAVEKKIRAIKNVDVKPEPGFVQVK